MYRPFRVFYNRNTKEYYIKDGDKQVVVKPPKKLLNIPSLKQRLAAITRYLIKKGVRRGKRGKKEPKPRKKAVGRYRGKMTDKKLTEKAINALILKLLSERDKMSGKEKKELADSIKIVNGKPELTKNLIKYFPDEAKIGELEIKWERIARNAAKIRDDVGEDLDPSDRKDLQRMGIRYKKYSSFKTNRGKLNNYDEYSKLANDEIAQLDKLNAKYKTDPPKASEIVASEADALDEFLEDTILDTDTASKLGSRSSSKASSKVSSKDPSPTKTRQSDIVLERIPVTVEEFNSSSASKTSKDNLKKLIGRLGEKNVTKADLKTLFDYDQAVKFMQDLGISQPNKYSKTAVSKLITDRGLTAGEIKQVEEIKNKLIPKVISLNMRAYGKGTFYRQEDVIPIKNLGANIENITQLTSDQNEDPEDFDIEEIDMEEKEPDKESTASKKSITQRFKGLFSRTKTEPEEEKKKDSRSFMSKNVPPAKKERKGAVKILRSSDPSLMQPSIDEEDEDEEKKEPSKAESKSESKAESKSESKESSETSTSGNEDDEDDGNQSGSGKKSDNSLYDDEIDNYMKYSNTYLGTIPYDKIPTLDITEDNCPISFIVNTATSDQAGSKDPDVQHHWVAIYIDGDSLEYFDPLAETDQNILFELIKKIQNPKNGFDNMLKLKINKVKHQDDDASTCGYHCIDFIQARDDGEPFITASGYDISPMRENQIGEKFQLF